jgi:predicted lipoprotein with Yx(FWY)xxD motif
MSRSDTARMKNTSLLFGLIVSSLLAGCGGGGGTSAAPNPNPGPIATIAPVTSTNALTTASVAGAPAYVTPANMPVYIFGGDTAPNTSTCTGQCLATWPAVAPPSGTLNAPWASFTRTDNSTVQLSVNGHALYTFVSDSPFTARGDNVENFHLARPADAAGDAGATGGGNTGPYGP